MDLPPLVDPAHGDGPWPRTGFIPPPPGAESERGLLGGAQSSSAWPAAPAWPIQPLPWSTPSPGSYAPSTAFQPSNWSAYSVYDPKPFPIYPEPTSTSMAVAPTLGGGNAQESTWGWPILPSPSFDGGGNPIPEWKEDAFDEGTKRFDSGWSMSQPRVERRRKNYSCARKRVPDGGNVFSNRPGILDQTSRGNWSPPVSTSYSDRSRSPTPGPRPLPHTYYQPPAVSAGLYRKDDPENFSSFHSFRPYVAIDPFVPSMAQSIANVTPASEPTIMQPQGWPIPSTGAHGATNVPISRYIFAFLFDTVPRQIYLYFLLTLPSLYFSRVASIFEKAGLSMLDIKRMEIAPVNERDGCFDAWTPTPSVDSQRVARLRETWERFIDDSLGGEWIVLNLVSIFLLPAILMTLQIDGALTDPYIRYSAFLALVCSLMSVSYGCLYTIKFDTMRKAVQWAEEAQKTRTSIWWNLWVMLAMPAVWLSWSIMFYLACVMMLVWRTGTTSDTVAQAAPLAVLDPRIIVTLTFTLGLVYLCLIIREFRRRGDATDKVQRKRVFESAEPSRNTYYTWKVPGYMNSFDTK